MRHSSQCQSLQCLELSMKILPEGMLPFTQRYSFQCSKGGNSHSKSWTSSSPILPQSQCDPFITQEPTVIPHTYIHMGYLLTQNLLYFSPIIIMRLPSSHLSIYSWACYLWKRLFIPPFTTRYHWIQLDSMLSYWVVWARFEQSNSMVQPHGWVVIENIFWFNSYFG